MKTLFVNLYAGPGTGKSTTAAEVFSKLKRADSNAEYVQEYAKDLTWGQETHKLGNQLYVTSKQVHRQYRLEGQVDVAVTDSPILLGAFCYPGFGSGLLFLPLMLEVYREFRNLNIFLERDSTTHKYNPKGRSQSEQEAMGIDRVIRHQLEKNKLAFNIVKAGPEAADQIMELIRKELG